VAPSVVSYSIVTSQGEAVDEVMKNIRLHFIYTDSSGGLIIRSGENVFTVKRDWVLKVLNKCAELGDIKTFTVLDEGAPCIQYFYNKHLTLHIGTYP
jgi:hypothetical protein